MLANILYMVRFDLAKRIGMKPVLLFTYKDRKPLTKISSYLKFVDFHKSEYDLAKIKV